VGQFVLIVLSHGLQLKGALLGQRHGREGHFVGLGHCSEVEVILGVDARRDVDVELKHLEEEAFQFVPGIEKKIILSQKKFV
jgi:hypothetical protein